MDEGGGDEGVTTFVARLYDWCVLAGDHGGEMGEVGEKEAVVREVGGEDVEELEEASGDVFGFCEVRGEGEFVAETTEPVGVVRGGDWSFGWLVAGCCAADAEEAGDEVVELGF
ncbi:hypothetical protein ES702_04678 [subsurface metagenome]